MTIDDELSPYRDPYLKNMLEEERRRLGGSSEARREELRRMIEGRVSDLEDDSSMDARYEEYRDSLPEEQLPASRRQDSNLFVEWENRLKSELQLWKDEFDSLEAQIVDGQLVHRNVRERIIRLLEAEARQAGLIPRAISRAEFQQQGAEGNNGESVGHWVSFSELAAMGKAGATNSVKPSRLLFPDGNNSPVKNWIDLIAQTAEWLIREGLLTRASCPVVVGGMRSRYLIHVEPIHRDGSDMSPKKLSGGLVLDANLAARRIAWLCELFVEKLGEDPSQFSVQLSR